MNKKIQRLMLIAYIGTLLIMLTGATYAYFTMIRVSKISPVVDVKTATTNFSSFDSGNPIYINPTVDNFKEGMGNLSSETFASAYLKVENPSAEKEIKYNFILNIETNNLEYSSDKQNAELLLKVTDPNGDELTQIEGLKYVSVTDGKGEEQTGFDLTTSLGKYFIAKDYVLKTNTEVTQNWYVKITYINLGEKQDKNFDKKLEGFVKIEKAG